MAKPRGALAHVSKTGRRANAPKVQADKSAGANGPTPKSGRVASAQDVDTVSKQTSAGDNVELTEHGKANGATAESVATAGRADADNPPNRSPPTPLRGGRPLLAVLFSPVPTASEPNAGTPLALAKAGLWHELPQAAKNDDEKEEKKTVNADELSKQTYKRFKPNVKLMKILKSLPPKFKEYLEHVHTDAQSAEFLSQISLEELAAFTHGAHKQADKNSQIAQRLLHKCKEHMLRLKELSKGGRTDHEEVEALEVTEAERDKYIARFTYFRKLMLAGVVAYRLLGEVSSLKARTKELEKELKRANDTAEADWLRLAADKSELEQERQGLEQERQGLEQANAQLTTTSRRFKLAMGRFVRGEREEAGASAALAPLSDVSGDAAPASASTSDDDSSGEERGRAPERRAPRARPSRGQSQPCQATADDVRAAEQQADRNRRLRAVRESDALDEQLSRARQAFGQELLAGVLKDIRQRGDMRQRRRSISSSPLRGRGSARVGAGRSGSCSPPHYRRSAEAGAPTPSTTLPPPRCRLESDDDDNDSTSPTRLDVAPAPASASAPAASTSAAAAVPPGRLPLWRLAPRAAPRG